MFGAGRGMAIDGVPERLAMAKEHGNAEIIDVTRAKGYDQLMEMTRGRGPDPCVAAVGAEAPARGRRPLQALPETMMCCRKGGTVSIPGVYIGLLDKLPFGAAMNKGLTLRMGQTNMPKYMKPLLERIQAGEIDPAFVIT